MFSGARPPTVQGALRSVMILEGQELTDEQVEDLIRSQNNEMERLSSLIKQVMAENRILLTENERKQELLLKLVKPLSSEEIIDRLSVESEYT